jgi:hypothetical protein
MPGMRFVQQCADILESDTSYDYGTSTNQELHSRLGEIYRERRNVMSSCCCSGVSPLKLEVICRASPA